MAVIRKVKDKIKKIVRSSKKTPVRAKVKKASSVKRPARSIKAKPEAIASGIKHHILGSNEVAVEKTKFSHPEVPKVRRDMPSELPTAYGKDTMVLAVRDPWWLHAYWEVTSDTWEQAKHKAKDAFYAAKKALRVYDVSNIIFNGSNAHRYFDIEVHHESQAWYIDTGSPGRSWCVDYGLKLPSGEFITILRSNVVTTPLDSPSWVTDEEWMVPEEMFGKLYGLGFGFGQSSPVGKTWMKRALFSGVLSSPGMTSMGSPVRLPKAKSRKFWMVVDCELIVYGATEPDAKVTVQGKPIRLRPDGSFTLRFSLPDGQQVIPVKGVSADDLEERVITPIVSRETKSSTVVKEDAQV